MSQFPVVSDDETAANGPVWRKIELGNAPGRLGRHNVLTKNSGPIGHSKRLIVKGIFSSTWLVLIDPDILANTKSCTELDLQDDS